jgi:radical SAM superfamily enzyme YgiQ (UPF0313 family)
MIVVPGFDMKVILINPAFNRYGGVKGHGGSMVPLNLCYLASYARQQNPDIDIRILDSEIKGLSHEDTVDETAAYSPDLIGITANTCSFDSVSALAAVLKERLPKVPIIIGGPHTSALPERSLLESKADFVAIGEGELTFEEVIAKIKGGGDGWDEINGLAFRDGSGRIRINAPRQLISDLDILPFPARDLVENNLYSPPATKRVSLGPNTLVATSRGCPYNCGFCGAQTVWTRRTRTRSPENVVAEIKECIDRYGIRSFNFTDEFFTAQKRRVTDICRLVCERGLDISWVCSARAQRLDRETLEMMKRAGCHEISFGIESGNAGILKKIDKSLDLEEAVRVVNLAKEVGITTHASYMLGYIGETEETMRDTIRFAKRLNSHVAAFFIASPLPGTPLYDEALERGYLRPDATWSDYSPLSNRESVLTFPNLSNATIREWHRKAIKGYYLRAGYIASRFLAIRHWHDIANLFGGLKIFLQIKR